jgi:tRNA(fMet)-specific endonuclease VapC
LIDEADVIILPVNVPGELLYGALNSAKTKKNEQVIQEFSTYSLVMQVDEAIATRYAKVRFNLKKNGTPIPEMIYGLPQHV